jgi:Tetratricopeptide repeat
MPPPASTLDFEEIVFQASRLDPPEWRTAIAKGIARLEDQWTREPSASIAYAIGYSLFHMPGHEERDLVAAETWLRRALTLAPGDMYAAYYLGSLYFEYARPDQALDVLSRIPTTWFSQFDQDWRDMKRREVVLCCRMMRHEDVDEQEVRNIMGVHQAHPTEQVWPLPEELVSTTVQLITSTPGSQPLQALAAVLIDEIERAGLADLYANEMSTLRRLAIPKIP